MSRSAGLSATTLVTLMPISKATGLCRERRSHRQHGRGMRSEMEKKLTPSRAIRQFCLWCMGGRKDFVRSCCNGPGADFVCPLFLCRMGRIEKGSPRGLLAPIHMMCVACANTPQGVRECLSDKDCEARGVEPCSLHSFRFGRSPNYSQEAREQRRLRAKEMIAQGILPGTPKRSAAIPQNGSLAQEIRPRRMAPIPM